MKNWSIVAFSFSVLTSINKSVLVAIRVLRAATELGWDTVSIYTEGDESHATFSDHAIKLDDTSDYLNFEKISAVAVKAGCTHLHPGYGFLSESPSLAATLPNFVIFIGPSIKCLKIASNKILSRNLAISLGVNVAPGSKVNSIEDVEAFTKAQGYPVMLKALDGGGGRGIRIVETKDAVEEAFKRCLGESPSRQIFVEKALTGRSWKHIEIQIVGDGSGAVTHLWERECSIQRRFQKIIEVAPSRLPRDNIRPLVESSLKIAQHLKYHGLGTFEYLVNSRTGEWVFLEINPRVQVEHTVTGRYLQEVTGVDLVRTQLLLFLPSASLASLSLNAPPHAPRGHAIQLRVTAEDSSKSFALTPGTIKASDINWPSGQGVRIDTWLIDGPLSDNTLPEWTVGTEFDSLLAKIIVRGSNFEDATWKAHRAAKELKIRGKVKTNQNLLMGVLRHPDWISGDIDTLWLERNTGTVLTAGNEALKSRRPTVVRLTPHQDPTMQENLKTAGTVALQPGALFHLTISLVGSSNTTRHTLALNSIAQNGFPERLSGTLQTTLSSAPLSFSLSQSSSAAVSSSAFELAEPNDETHIAAPFTGKIVELHPALSATMNNGPIDTRNIKKGETIVIMSVMKMESVITAPYNGTLKRVGKGIRVGTIVGEGMLVCVLDGGTDISISRL
ncbi:hypothetical protein BDZ94DRAFT_1312835 [Collybia nuda]|uniref:Pyruvate carboxylase n=1 Tax=Collybia nuda TaxID=64659 RepID=A0A9P6CFG4_9AGAR|nr:hypothetical protein BDZ94DRAFT_1312835 [Collybia nuda]